MSSYISFDDIDSIFERIRDESASRTSGIRSSLSQEASSAKNIRSVTFSTPNPPSANDVACSASASSASSTNAAAVCSVFCSASSTCAAAVCSACPTSSASSTTAAAVCSACSASSTTNAASLASSASSTSSQIGEPVRTFFLLYFYWFVC